MTNTSRTRAQRGLPTPAARTGSVCTTSTQAAGFSHEGPIASTAERIGTEASLSAAGQLEQQRRARGYLGDDAALPAGAVGVSF